ncbi:MAG: hypothetical protein AUJ98_00740 [Bacteroidetes bacterium CG2_30_33_31]|nr:MAG: hypothetical protein AUJ98_00740 [Bacteroidetes bacterium CG2_30_33_31]
MKSLTVVLVFFLSLSSVYAGNISKNNPTVAENTETSSLSVSGKVVDLNSGESLAGAEVKIEGLDLVSYTDLDGKFEFKNLKSGSYSIIVTYISYKNSLIENFPLTNISNKNIEVKLMPKSN